MAMGSDPLHAGMAGERLPACESTWSGPKRTVLGKDILRGYHEVGFPSG